MQRACAMNLVIEPVVLRARHGVTRHARRDNLPVTTMRRYDIHPKHGPSFELAAETWMGALGEALERLGRHGEDVDCDIDESGDISVRTRSASFVVRDAESGSLGGEARLGDLPHDLPPTLAEDAPDPMDAPAWRRHEEAGDLALANLEGRSVILDRAPDANAAASWGLDLLMEHVPAQSGAVLRVDPVTRDLVFACARGPRAAGLTGMPVPSGRGIAGLTVRAGIALTVREADLDPRHYSEVDERTGYRTHAIVSVPIRGLREALGCVQLINPFAGTWFLPWHQTAAQHVAQRLARRLSTLPPL